MLPIFHPLDSSLADPSRFTAPFCYEPHPLCLAAAAEVQRYIMSDGALRADAGRGKMFGVLVVRTADGRRGFLAAYSGLLAGRNDHAYFVPPVFDAMQPDGYFKTHEAEITAINRQIDAILHSERYAEARCLRSRIEQCNKAEEDAFRLKMAEAKAARDARRSSGEPVTADDEARMIRESQFMKAELRRIRQRGKERLCEAEAAVSEVEAHVSRLKAQRKAMSDSLQRWLFSRYSMLDARGERRDLCSIFASTPGGVPPSGAGDCCAPKLLQCAYLNGLRPVCMAEFWWGASPAHEVRHHLHYYPACRGKCLPILTHMLKGLDVEKGSVERGVSQPLEIVYEDEWLAVVNKPSGMKSVPGKGVAASVFDEMCLRRAGKPRVMLPHRLDMDTSGLLLVAYDEDTYRKLQAQFAAREVKKRYVALLDGVPDRPASGTISLPLRPDPLDRPYQKVDYDNGKDAVTEYKITDNDGRFARVELFPLTGRTHQLRVHCAHAAGLGTPIVGDRLYGHGTGSRLCLHAEELSFTHPATGRRMAFRTPAAFFLASDNGIMDK